MSRRAKVFIAICVAISWIGSIPAGLLGKPLEGWAAEHWPVILPFVGVALMAAIWVAVFSPTAGSGPATTPLPQVLNDLSKAVREGWRKEAKNRGIYGRDVLLAGHWSPAPGHEGAGPAAGAGRRRLDSAEAIVRAFQDQPAPWLVVLGDPGAGKSTVALLLTLGLLDARAAEAGAAENGMSGEPVPVLFTIASWDPDREFLVTWLKRRLLEEYPRLRRAAGPQDRDALLQNLLDDGRLLPVLDGMDEIKAELRSKAIRAIKESGLPRLVLTCRAEEYDRAVAGGQDMLLHTATVKLEPIRLSDTIEFLPRGMPPHERARWEPLLDGLRRRPDGPLAKVFSTPLMISLARDVYKERETDPGELADEDRFPTRAVIATHLLEGLIAAKFPKLPVAERQDWEGEDAMRWLTYLADRMQHERVSEIAWWELSRLAPRPLRILIGLAGGLMAGASVGLGFGVLAAHLFDSAVVGWSVGGPLGLFFALVMGHASFKTTPKPSDLHFGVTGRRRATLASGLIVGSIGGGVGFLLGGAGFAVVVGMLSGVLIGLVYGLAAPDATEETVAPRQLLEQDRRVALIFGAVYALTTAFAGGVGVNPIFGLALAVSCGLAGGLLYGPVWVFALDKGKAGVISWMHLLFVRLWLTPQGRLPWRLLSFLEEAHRRGVLRQTGAVYQFRHAFLQEALAGVPPRPVEDHATD